MGAQLNTGTSTGWINGQHMNIMKLNKGKRQSYPQEEINRAPVQHRGQLAEKEFDRKCLEDPGLTKPAKCPCGKEEH